MTQSIVRAIDVGYGNTKFVQRPAWLDTAHKALDSAVAAAYGWTDYTPEMPDDEILRRLLSLNLQRSAQAGAASS